MQKLLRRAQIYKDNIILQLETNCSIIEKDPPKGESFSDFIASFIVCLSGWIHILICNTKIDEKSDMKNPEQLFVAQELKKLYL